jgi:hypothetical protein
MRTYLIPDPQSILTRQAGTVIGMPAPIAACRAVFCPCPAVAAYNRNTVLQCPNVGFVCLCKSQIYFTFMHMELDQTNSFLNTSSQFYVHRYLSNYFTLITNLNM